jgi:valyl-tRNA synthetase
VVSEYPTAKAYDQDLIQKVEQAKTVVSSVREIRSSKGIKRLEPLKLFAQDTKGAQTLLNTPGLKDMIVKMANLELLELTADEVPNTVSFLAGTEQFFVELDQEIDTEAECQKLKEDLEYQEGFLFKVNKKLANERFVNNAPEKVVALERKKQADATAKIQSIKEAMEQLGCR